MLNTAIVNPYIVPAATLVAAVFTGTIAAWIGTRLTLRRFKEERGFDRRVDWYERIARTMQQIRSICFEIMTTLSGMPARRYAELSERVGVLSREFDDLAGERYIYANAVAEREIGLRALASMQLKSRIPEQKGGRATSKFWEGQHTEWSQVHQLVSQELRHELSVDRRRSSWIGWKGRSNRGELPGGRGAPRTPGPSWRDRALAWIRRKQPVAESRESGGPQTSPHPQPDDGVAALDRVHQAAFETLWTCMKARESYVERGDAHRARLLDLATEAVFRLMDVSTAVNLLDDLERGSGYAAGWTRQMMRRILALMVLENSAVFSRKLDADLRETVRQLGGPAAAAALDRLISDLAGFQKKHAFKLQRSRNTIVAQAHTGVPSHLETIKGLSREESSRLGTESLDWYTRLFQELATVAGLQAASSQNE